jgi:hypothetical protein
MPIKKVMRQAGTKPEFWKLKAAAGIGNTRDLLIWHV